MVDHAEGWSFTLDQVHALIAELDRELAARRHHYPERIRKGDMLQSDADYRLAILAEIRADCDVAFHPAPWTVATGFNLPAPAFPWPAKIRELERIVAQRERHNPERIRKGELLEADAAAQLAAIGHVLELYRRHLFGYLPAAPLGTPEAQAEIRARILEQQPAGETAAA